MSVLGKDFYNRPTLSVAEDLLGALLVKKDRHTIHKLLITEVEAYDGPFDRASHAWRGLTGRTEVMFGPASVWYVYLVYGLHWMLNIVTGDEGYPAAVLIRGTKEVSGPARLTKYMKIDKRFNGLPALPANSLWIERDNALKINKANIITTPRIGVAYAGKLWSQKPYRFVLEI